MFKCLLIPADANVPMEEMSLSKSGGLTNDALSAHAKDYFRQHYQSNDNSDNSALAQASCLDIMAVTVPTRTNEYRAVSLYRFGGDRAQSLPANPRAMALVTSCGHALASQIHGNVFVGRAHDDEDSDIWERVDFTVDDANPKSPWCQVARSTGGGGGSGKAAASSLSGILQQTQTQSGNLQVVSGNDTGTAVGTTALSYGMDGAPAVSEQGYSWTQDKEEVEVRFVVPSETTAKDCKLHFGRNSLQVTVGGTVLVRGPTFLPIVADECTYTLTREAGAETKDLIVTLIKEEYSKTWTFVVQ